MDIFVDTVTHWFSGVVELSKAFIGAIAIMLVVVLISKLWTLVSEKITKLFSVNLRDLFLTGLVIINFFIVTPVAIGRYQSNLSLDVLVFVFASLLGIKVLMCNLSR
ncbi:MAG: hypothetical protein GY909_15665 [Oligoflexia bacterium]|nr:hypothetical protein [Oligoflexia bacterium]